MNPRTPQQEHTRRRHSVKVFETPDLIVRRKPARRPRRTQNTKGIVGY